MKVTSINFNDNKGGAARVAWELGRTLEEKNISVSYLVRNKFSDRDNVFELPKLNLLKNLNKYTNGKDSQLLYELIKSYVFSNDIDIGFKDQILNNQSVKDADIVHLHNIHGFGFFNLNVLPELSKKKKVVWTFHDMWPFTGHCVHSFECEKWKSGCGGCPHMRIQEPILFDTSNKSYEEKKEIYKKSKFTIVVPSKWLLKKVETSILKDKPIEVIYNGIDTLVFKKKGNKKVLKKKYGLPMNKKICLLVSDGGKNSQWKGWYYTEDIINRFRDNNELLFLSVGGTENKVGKNVIYLPFVKSKESLAEIYSACDLLLFTSVAENFPLVILEAMSCGLPIVSFNVGGVKEAVTNMRNGYIARYKDGNDLSKGVNWFLNLSDGEKDKFGDLNIKDVENKFSLKKMSESYLNLYDRLLSR